MQEYINKFWSLLFCESSLLHCKKKLMSLPTLNNLYTLLSASCSIMNALYSWQVEDSVHKVWYTFLMEFHLLLSHLPTNCQLVCHSSSVKFSLFFLQISDWPTCTSMHVELLHSCPTFCEPLGCGPPGFSVLGTQARIQARAWVDCCALLQGMFLIQW